MHLFLNQVSKRDPDERIVMVIDGTGWHRSGLLKAPENIYLLKLPPHAPERNPIDHVWDKLRKKFFHDRIFASFNTLEDLIVQGPNTLEQSAETVRTIVSWDCIVNSLITSSIK